MNVEVKGTIKNERLGIEAPFITKGEQSPSVVFGHFEGSVGASTLRHIDGWSFEAAKPSLYDDIEALEAGTIFTIQNRNVPYRGKAAYLRVADGYRSIGATYIGPDQTIPNIWGQFYDYTVTAIYTPAKGY